MDIKQKLQSEFSEVRDAFFEKENNMLFLRIEVSLRTLDEVTMLSRKISDYLDQNDPSEKEYYLDIYSAGTETGIAIDELENNLEQYVQIELKVPEKNKDEYTGILVSCDENKVVVKWNAKGQFRKQEINLSNIKSAKKATKF